VVKVQSTGSIQRPPQMQRAAAPQKPVPLPRAVAIYGAASAVFAVMTIFTLFSGRIITGVIMILPTLCLAGYAWYYLKISSQKPW
jgi:hypothetical protein